MHNKLIATGLIAAAIFVAGNAVGQLRGTTVGFAASTTATATPLASPVTNDRGQDKHGNQSDGGRHADGTVTAVNGTTMTLSADTDPVGSSEYTAVTTIVLTNSTQVGAGHDQTATASAIKAGAYIIADGSVSADGKTLTATEIRILPNGPVAGR